MHNHSSAPESRTATGGPDGPQPDHAAEAQPSHSMWWMVACCAPMVLIALAIFLGVFGPR
jgi:hypothetical protein